MSFLVLVVDDEPDVEMLRTDVRSGVKRRRSARSRPRSALPLEADIAVAVACIGFAPKRTPNIGPHPANVGKACPHKMV
jgi:hypothetical protein